MTEFTRTREEVRARIERFLEANREAEQSHDWTVLTGFYAEDAVYRYSMGKFGERVARGRDEIRRLVMEHDMRGFEGWTFPYDWVVIDGDRVMTRWYNQAPVNRPDGAPYRVVGMSAIRLNNDLEITEMQDNFDLAALMAMVEELNQQGAGIHLPAPDRA